MGTPAAQTIRLYKGATKSFQVYCTNEDDEAIDLSDVAEIYFTVRSKDGAQGVPIIFKQWVEAEDEGISYDDQTDADNTGYATITLSTDDSDALATGKLRYDVALFDIDGDGERHEVIPPSDFIILDAVGRTADDA